MSAPPTTFRLIDWPSPPMQQVDPLGLYAEAYWLPIIHPTAYLLGRKLVRSLIQSDPDRGSATMGALDLAHALGIVDFAALAKGGGGLRIYVRAAKRLERYKLVRWQEDAAEVRARWPRLPAALLVALPEHMREAEPDHWRAQLGPLRNSA